MSTSLLEDIAAAPDIPEADLFASPVLEDDDDAPQRTREPKAKGRGSRTRERECEKCGNTYVGGHKLCNDCKGTAPSRSTTTNPRGSAKLEEDLLETTVSIASDIAAVAPTVAGVLVARAETTVSGLMALAKGRPRVTKALQKVASVSQVAELMSVVLMLVVAAMVDLGNLGEDSPLLDAIGFAEIQRDANGKSKRDDNGLLVKNRMTIRDIHEEMTGGRKDPPADENGMPEWTPNNGVNHGAGYTMPPMNWVP